jgi:uncharacterized protein YkuJ
MKKLFTIIALFAGLNIWSQTSHTLPVNNKPDDFGVYVQLKDNSFSPGFKNDVNTNALRHFVETFEGAENISWHVSDDKTEATFTMGNTKMSSYYDKHGDHICTIKYYTEKELDSSLAKFVKKEAGKDYSIYLVTEFIEEGSSLFDISLQNDKYWLKIKFLITPDKSLEKLENRTFRKG